MVEVLERRDRPLPVEVDPDDGLSGQVVGVSGGTCTVFVGWSAPRRCRRAHRGRG